MNQMLDRFLSMPVVMRIVCMTMFASPVIAVLSVLTNSIDRPQIIERDYGAVSNGLGMMLLMIVTLPGFLGAILMLKKCRVGIHLFAAGYLGATIGPLILGNTWKSTELLAQTVAIVLICGAIAYAYLCLSKEVRSYFDSQR